MNKRAERALDALEDSCLSASLAVADHIRTVASNGGESATLEAMRTEAEALIEAAQDFLEQTKPRRKKVTQAILDEMSLQKTI